MRILVTAGPTWAEIDSVRVLTNRFTGKTGLYLAKQLAKKGHAVTLLINPHACGRTKGLRVLPFYYFSQLKKILEKELKEGSYQAVIHSAAVNDYLPEVVKKGKIPSGKANLNLSLVRAPKLIKVIRKLAKDALLIQFKLEEKKDGLIDKAYRSLKENESDYVVANALEELKTGYKVLLIGLDKKITVLNSKNSLAGQIDKILKK